MRASDSVRVEVVHSGKSPRGDLLVDGYGRPLVPGYLSLLLPSFAA